MFIQAGRIVRTNFHRVQRIKQLQSVESAFREQIWRWRRIKSSTESVGQSLDKEFLVDDTAITTTYISRKLDELEKFAKQANQVQKDGKKDGVFNRRSYSRYPDPHPEEYHDDSGTKNRWNKAAQALSKPMQRISSVISGKRSNKNVANLGRAGSAYSGSAEIALTPKVGRSTRSKSYRTNTKSNDQDPTKLAPLFETANNRLTPQLTSPMSAIVLTDIAEEQESLTRVSQTVTTTVGIRKWKK